MVDGIVELLVWDCTLGCTGDIEGLIRVFFETVTELIDHGGIGIP